MQKKRKSAKIYSMSIEKITLKNQVTLITNEIPLSKVTTFGFYFSVGSRFEGEKERGISHFTEHMLFKGTKTKSNKEILMAFDRMGGVFNAFTERENVGVYCTVPTENKANFITALDTLCDLSENCVFPKEEMEKERQVVINEILSVLDDPDDSAMDELALTAWPNQNISLPITGTVSDVKSITQSQMIDFYKKHFVEGELVVIVSGKIYKDLLLSSLEKLLSRKTSLEFFKNLHFKEKAIWKPEKRIVKTKFNQTQVFVMYPLKSNLCFADYISLLIFNCAAGETMSSRLFYSLREKDGLCYSVGSFYTTYENAGFWSSYAVCEGKKAEEVFDKMSKEILGFSKKEISDEEIEVAKERLCGSEVISETRTSFLNQRLWNFYSMGFPLFETDSLLESIRSAKKSDIITFIKGLLDEEKKTSLFYGPIK